MKRLVMSISKAVPDEVDAMLEGLDLVKSGVIIKHDQRLDGGTYEGWFGKKKPN